MLSRRMVASRNYNSCAPVGSDPTFSRVSRCADATKERRRCAQQRLGVDRPSAEQKAQNGKIDWKWTPDSAGRRLVGVGLFGRAVILQTGRPQAAQAMPVDRALPGEELLNRERVA